eukprot:9596171-Heterocapsa_arctica.AAC.1
MVFLPAPPAQQKRKKFQSQMFVVHVYVLWGMSEVLVDLIGRLSPARVPGLSWRVSVVGTLRCPGCDVPASVVEDLVVDGVGVIDNVGAIDDVGAINGDGATGVAGF